MTDEPNIQPEDFQPDTAQQSERHASNLELFLDLVFVFAVTQIAGLFASDTGPGGFGLEFAGAYLAVNLWALAIQGRGLWGAAATRQAWLQYVPLAAIAPVLVLVGASFDRGPRRYGGHAVDDRPRALRRASFPLRHHLLG